MTAGFVEQVSAVSPLDGDAIDGSERPKPRRPRKLPRERMDAWAARRCSACGFTSIDLAEYSDHVSSELWKRRVEIVGADAEDLERPRDAIEVRQRGLAVAKLPSVLGDYKTWLENLTDEEIRSAKAASERARRRGEPVPEETKIIVREGVRRYKQTYSRSSPAERTRLRETRRERAAQTHRQDRQRREQLLPSPDERRELRRARDMTMKDLADEIGVCPQLIHQWEHGHQVPGWPNLRRYTDALGWNP